MNRAYRLIWSAARDAYLVAPETARGHGKSGRALAAPALVAVFCLAMSGLAQAQAQPQPASTVVPVPGAAEAYVSANGVPVVNINTANGAGVSHNQYTRYDVETHGLVLNNGNASLAARQSQLAGQVIANPNLGAEAKVILNQVVSPARSTLAGFTEVLGGRADIIVANPYGITCTGCGFINSDRATLTTGTPTWGADGSVAGFNVSRGDVLINGAGLNASAQQMLDIVTRSLRVDGQINGNTVGITTGNNQWSYDSRSVTGSTVPSDDQPLYAIDSSALGGMYAGRIRMIATEAGVGVRMLGEAAAMSEDFSLNSAGRVVLQGRLSAARDVQLTQTGDTGAAALQISGANASANAGRTLAITADGGVALAEGMLKAGADLALRARSLNDSSSTQASRSAEGNVDVALTGDAAMHGASWGAGQQLRVQAGSLAVDSGARLYSGANAAAANRGMILGSDGAMTLGDGKLASATGMTLAAKEGLTTGAGLAAEAAADMALIAGGVLTNDGKLLAAKEMTVRSAAPDAALNILNRGLLQAGKLGMGAAGRQLALNNSGALLGDTVDFHGASLDNSGRIQATSGLSATAGGAIANRAGGALLSTASGSSLSLAGATLENGGVVQSAGALNINTSDVTVNQGTLLTTRSADGGADGDLTLRTGRLNNSGVIAAAGAGRLSAAAVFANTGKVQGRSMDLAAAVLRNFGSGSDIHGVDSVLVRGNSNSGLTLLNQGTLRSGGALDVGAAGRTTINNFDGAAIAAAGKLALNGRALDNSGLLQGGNGVASDMADAFINRGSGQVLATGGDVALKAGSIENSGQLQAAGSLTAKAGSALDNRGAILAQGGAGNLSLEAATLNNSASGAVQGANAVLLSVADSIDNRGLIQAGGDMRLRAGNRVANMGASRMLGAGAIRIDGPAARLDVLNQGRIQAAGLLQLGSFNETEALKSLTNTAGGTLMGGELGIYGITLFNSDRIQSQGAARIRMGSLNNRNSKAAIVTGLDGSASSMDVANTLDNQGAIHNGGRLDINAGRIRNGDTAGISSQRDLTLTSRAEGMENSGALYAGGLLRMAAAGQAISNQGSGTMDANDISLDAGKFTNYNTVTARNNIRIATSEEFRNLPVGGLPSISKEFHYDPVVVVSDTTDKNGIRTILREQTRTVTDKLDGNMPAVKGQIIAGNTLDIDYGRMGLNQASLLSAPNVNIGSSDPNSQGFINKDFHLEVHTSKRRSMEIDTPVFNIFGILIGSDVKFWYPEDATQFGNPARFSGSANSSGAALQSSVNLALEHHPIAIYDAGIYATNLKVEGGSLENLGRPYKANPHAISTEGMAAQDASWLAGKPGALVAPGARDGGTAAATGISFAGLNLRLPRNPNGYFVVAKDPAARYLVETNSLFGSSAGIDSPTGAGAGADAGVLPGSDYLAMQLGFNPETLQKRLGDARYENWLVRQQLIARTGNNLLQGAASEAVQFKTLLDNSTAQASALGLAFGVALSEAQAAAVKNDLVWMVEQEVDGQKVLAPVVYLSQATRQGIVRGTVLAADTVDMQVASLSNDGGLINSARRLSVKSDGDVRNISGAIKGGDVAITSAKGSIVNATLAETYGEGNLVRSQVGNTAAITSGGAMQLQAGKDIEVKGAQVQAKTDAVLRATGDLTIDTVVDKQAGTAMLPGKRIFGLGDNSVETSNARATNLASAVQAGGSLDMSSGGNMEIAAARVKAGGDLLLDSGGKLDVLARNDTSTNSRSTTTSGDSIGGGARGTTVATVEKFESVNRGSAIESGGDAILLAKGAVTVKGSGMDAQGKLGLAAEDIRVQAGENIERVSTTTETTTYLKTGSSGIASAKASAGGKANAVTESRAESLKMVDGVAVRDPRGGAGTRNEASVSSDKSVDISRVKDETGKVEVRGEVKGEDRSTLKNDVGSEGAHPLSARGLEASKSDTASASAEGTASASASASGKAKLAVVETVIDKTSEEKTSVARSVLSGNDVTLMSRKDIELEAASVRAARDVRLEGKDIRIVAAENKTISTTSRNATEVGLLLDSKNTASADASASGKADAKVSHLARDKGHEANASAAVSGQASAKAAAKSDNKIDLFRTSGSASTTTAIDNTGADIVAGGKLGMTAAEALVVEGSDLKGTKAVGLQAKRMEFLAADNSLETRTTSNSTSVGLALKGEGSAQASARGSLEAEASGKLADKGMLNRDSAQGKLSGAASGSASASADARGEAGIQFQHKTTSDEKSSTTAKVANIRSEAGDVTRTAQGNIKDVGTAIDAAGNFTQTAGSVTSLAARNTASEHSESSEHEGRLVVYGKAGAGVAAKASASGQAGVGYLGGNTLDGQTESDTAKGTRAGAGAGVELQYQFTGKDKRSDSSTAVVSSIKAGGTLSSASSGETVLEGSKLAGGKDVDLSAQRVEFKAASDTKSSTEKNTSAGGKLSAGAGVGTTSAVEGGLSGNLEMTEETSTSSRARVGGIAAGGKLTVRSQGDMVLEGTDLNAGGDADVKAGGKLAYNAAADKKTLTTSKVGAGLKLEGGKEDTSNAVGKIDLSGGYEKTGSADSKAVVGKLAAGGNIRMEGEQAATLEGTEVKAKGDVDIGSKGKLTLGAARDISDSDKLKISGSVNMGGAKSGNEEKKTSGHESSAGVQAAGEYEKTHTDQAKTASVTAGGTLKTRSGGDSEFEGTALKAGGKVDMGAGGNLAFKAAEDTSTTSSVKGSVKLAGAEGSKTAPKKNSPDLVTNKTETKKGGLELAVNQADNKTRKGGSIEAGEGGLQVNAGGNAGFEGAAMKSGADIAVAAGGDVVIDTARSTRQSAGASLGLDGMDKRNTIDTDKDLRTGKLDAAVHSSNKETHQASTMDAKGAVAIQSGGKTELVNAEMKAAGGTGISASSVERRKVENSESGINMGMSLSREVAGRKTDEKAGAKPAQKFEQATPTTDTAKSKVTIGDRSRKPAAGAKAGAAAKTADARKTTAGHPASTKARPRALAQSARNGGAHLTGK
jgi:filamentous hemagglutinin family protein